jgi:hypothetical protein
MLFSTGATPAPRPIVPVAAMAGAIGRRGRKETSPRALERSGALTANSSPGGMEAAPQSCERLEENEP